MSGDSLERAARDLHVEFEDKLPAAKGDWDGSVYRTAEWEKRYEYFCCGFHVAADFARDRLDAQRKEIVAEIRRRACEVGGDLPENPAEELIWVADAIEGGKEQP
jgi:hypothetical protein